ncbi:MAG: YHS domain-containing protein [Alphaproteobacteria bacterium]|jgi:YHS domain-containing protein
MKTMRLPLLVILLLSVFTSAAFAKDPIKTGTFNNKAIYGFDTVAYFTQGKPIKGQDDVTSEWRGATWHFSNVEHKTMFDDSPEKYAPQYGGHCAYAMSKGKFVGIDEDAFTIYNEKLYLNYSKGVREDWLKDKDGSIQLADDEYAAKADL